MRVVVVGAGLVGLYCALARAERGDEVVLVEKDPPPVTGERRGVMQFRHPHFFRPQVRMALELVPDAWDAVLSAGAVPAAIPGMPPEASAGMSGIACRRAVLETAIRGVAEADSRIRLVVGEATDFALTGARVTGVVVADEVLPADLVLCCTGRTGTLGDAWRPDGEGGPCGQSYVSRMYRFADGVDAFDQHFPMGAMGPGYLTIAFPQDDATLSALIVRSSGDKELAGLRDNAAFERVASAIPNLAPWIDPARFVPITDVMMGGLLTNTYRGQVREGAPGGVIFVGDAVSTTNPAAGRGVTLGLQQAVQLLRLLDADGPDAARQAFDLWCEDNIRPWYEDHVLNDAWLARRFHDEELDFDQPLPADLICDAALAEPALEEAVGGYRAMMALPTSLRAVEEKARAVYQSGWRPPVAGPSRAEIAALIRA